MNNKHKALWISSTLFALCALVFGVYWFSYARFHESTDDAYVNGNMIMLTPQISGIVTTILTDNTKLVEAGQPLIELDRHDYEIAFQNAKGNLAETVRQVCSMYILVEELKAKKQAAQSDLLRAKRDYMHRKELVGDASVSREDFEHSETTLSYALAYVKQVEKELGSAVAKVTSTTIETHPLVEQAKSSLRSSFLALHRCTVRSPTKAIVTLRKAQVGQWVSASTPLLSLVPLDQIWVDANFREVSLKNMRIGQPVELFSDMYGRSTKYHGKVVGLNPGTGSVFSVLPPQNATGNWIKIVQRVPVKISLDPKEVEQNPLVLGLSVIATTNTTERGGLQLPKLSAPEPIYDTQVYTDELAGADEMIDSIVKENMYGI
jgi:membrane fusion protein (multidrug efflux system)